MISESGNCVSLLLHIAGVKNWDASKSNLTGHKSQYYYIQFTIPPLIVPGRNFSDYLVTNKWLHSCPTENHVCSINNGAMTMMTDDKITQSKHEKECLLLILHFYALRDLSLCVFSQANLYGNAMKRVWFSNWIVMLHAHMDIARFHHHAIIHPRKSTQKFLLPCVLSCPYCSFVVDLLYIIVFRIAPLGRSYDASGSSEIILKGRGKILPLTIHTNTQKVSNRVQIHWDAQYVMCSEFCHRISAPYAQSITAHMIWSGTRGSTSKYSTKALHESTTQ